MIFQTRAGDYRKMGTEQCADGVTFTFQCPKELACAVVLFEKKTGKQAAKIDVLPQYRVGSVRSVTIYPLKAEKYYYCYEIEGKRVRDPLRRACDRQGKVGRYRENLQTMHC